MIGKCKCHRRRHVFLLEHQRIKENKTAEQGSNGIVLTYLLNVPNFDDRTQVDRIESDRVMSDTAIFRASKNRDHPMCLTSCRTSASGYRPFRLLVHPDPPVLRK